MLLWTFCSPECFEANYMHLMDGKINMKWGWGEDRSRTCEALRRPPFPSHQENAIFVRIHWCCSSQTHRAWAATLVIRISKRLKIKNTGPRQHLPQVLTALSTPEGFPWITLSPWKAHLLISSKLSSVHLEETQRFVFTVHGGEEGAGGHRGKQRAGVTGWACWRPKRQRGLGPELRKKRKINNSEPLRLKSMP